MNGPEMTYARPSNLGEALTLLGGGEWRVLAGGTDLYPATPRLELDGPVLDINDLGELRGFERTDSGWRIGARTTWTDVLAARLPPAFDALKLAAREVGSVQIQNVGTVAGNLCNASPAADGVPALMILDASIELTSTAGSRNLPLQDFILGNRRTARRAEELVTAILVPFAATRGVSHFLKLGARKYLVISIAMVAARIAFDDDGVVRDAAVSVGACSERACRLTDLERRLVGNPADSLGALVEADLVAPHLSPIDDSRATASYRLAAALEVVRRTVLVCTPHRRSGVAA